MQGLKFLGNGSAFNTKLGNTSAYIKANNSIILIDCGNTVFHKLKEEGILTDIKKLYIILTHTHADHAGSLSDLIFYSHFILKIKPIIHFPKNYMLEDLLKLQGVPFALYHINNRYFEQFVDANLGLTAIEFYDQKHVESIPAFRFNLKTKFGSFHYSGDGCTLSSATICNLKNGRLNALYQDTCALDYPDNPHLYIGKLAEIIKPDLREKVYCIHIDEQLTKDSIKCYGFNYIEL